jgi:hypothetical protein
VFTPAKKNHSLTPMKTRPLPTLLAIFLTAALLIMSLSSCSTPSDPVFMQNAGAAINGGPVTTLGGTMMMSSGLQNRNRPHPFFTAP